MWALTFRVRLGALLVAVAVLLSPGVALAATAPGESAGIAGGSSSGRPVDAETLKHVTDSFRAQTADSKAPEADGSEVAPSALYDGWIYLTTHTNGGTYPYVQGSRIDVETYATDHDYWGWYRVIIGVWDTQTSTFVFLYEDDEYVYYDRENWFWYDTSYLTASSDRYQVAAILWDDSSDTIEDSEFFYLTITEPSPVRPVYRFYRGSTGTHFYTADAAEMQRVRDTMSATYTFEGVGYYVNTANPANAAPLYRFYNRRTGTHLYTANEGEKNNILNTLGAIYSLDGVAYNVSMTAGTQVYRFYSPSKGVHFYSSDPNEIAYVRANLGHIWSFEGLAYLVAQ